MIYVSKEADKRLIEYLSCMDEVSLCGPFPGLPSPISCHADLLYVRLGAGKNAGIFKGSEANLGSVYPKDCIYCAVIAGNYLIHNKKYTDLSLSDTVKKTINDIQLIDVSQGYTRCNVAVIDDSHVITSDRGIHKALKDTKIECLLISPKQIILPGYEYGFIGGCMGRVGDEIIFNGDLSKHSDFERIRDFVRGCGLSLKYFEEYPLADIGSIIAG